jgi:hypothetical protein
VLILFSPGCRKDEAAPEAFITLKNNEGFQYRDTTMAVSDVRLFVLITARKGDSYLAKFGNTLFINDKIIGSDTSNLADEKREGFQAKWYYGAPPGTEKGKLVWEFFVMDEAGKKTATQLNIDLK